MSDQELRDELAELKVKMEKLDRYQEVIELANNLISTPSNIVALSCEWRMEEYAHTDDGLIDLKVLLNEELVVKFKVPNNSEEEVEHARPALLADYLDRASSNMSRQIEQILRN
ncbi:hypothetical protein [Yoonia sp. BS5-3]|uniref:Uncharacterized protein n=1 Tax=Yoonia phaeophyticola TaxID=3137369 RepID=A0ABZ2V5F3_9RHOB